MPVTGWAWPADIRGEQRGSLPPEDPENTQATRPETQRDRKPFPRAADVPTRQDG